MNETKRNGKQHGKSAGKKKLKGAKRQKRQKRIRSHLLMICNIFTIVFLYFLGFFLIESRILVKLTLFFVVFFHACCLRFVSSISLVLSRRHFCFICILFSENNFSSFVFLFLSPSCFDILSPFPTLIVFFLFVSMHSH